MAETLAGFVCGYALALLVTPVGAIAIVRLRVSNQTLRGVVPPGTSLIAVSVVLHLFAILALTALGLLLGLLLYGLENGSPAGGLGSPNRIYTAFVLIATAVALGPPALLVPRARGPLAGTALAIAGVFGWAMPYLSLLGPGQD